MSLAVMPTYVHAAQWLTTQVSGDLHCDSRAVRPGDGFIAWPGAAFDARQFVAQALQAGASACLVEAEGAEAFAFDDARISSLCGLKAATGPVANAFYGQPSQHLKMLASTGTNGKTSTAWWLAQALTLLGQRCAVVGTLGVGEPGAVQSTGLTTPDPVTLHCALRRFVDAGFAACALEASSIGLMEQRLHGASINVALFTNFTQDHLDFHGSMAAYWSAKRALFDWPGLQAAVVNIDDPQGALLAQELSARGDALWTVSMRGPARLQGSALRYDTQGLSFDVIEGDQQVRVCSQLVGDYNANNLLVVLAGLRALGVPLAAAAAVLSQLTAVPGRLQRVPSPHGGEPVPEVVVDYAHTPDALDKVLHALRPLASARGGQLWCVFGCGGDRDVSKRPVMGAIAARLADHAVITSDNPRNEVPAAILAQVMAGATQVKTHFPPAAIEDRREAIQHAVARAASQDLILIAGKGHEDYQEVAGVRRPFSDLSVAAERLQRRSASRRHALAAQGPSA